jgi:hypothetical protein
VGCLVDLYAGTWHRIVWRGLGGTLNGQTTKGGGIGSLGGGG